MNSHVSHTVFLKWRFILLITTFVGYVIYYITRKSIVYAMSILQKDKTLSFSLDTFGLMASMQMCGYFCGKFFCGLISDYFSSKLIFSIGLFCIGLVNVGYSCSNTSLQFIGLHGINGLFQGCGWAPIAKLIRRWYAPDEIGTIWSLLSTSINLSSSFTPFLIAILSDYFHWRTIFQIIGILALGFSFVSYVFIIDTHNDLPGSRYTQVSGRSQNGEGSQITKCVSYGELFSSRYFCLMTISYFVWCYVRSGLEDWLQLYFIDGRHLNKYQASTMMLYFQIGGLLASFSSGIISDRLFKKFNKQWRSNPRIPVVLFCSTFILPCLFLLHTQQVQHTILIGLLCLLVGYCCYGPHTLYGLMIMENAPDNLSGTAHAVAAAISTGGSILAGYPITKLHDMYNWNGVFAAFVLVAIINVTLLILLLTTDCRIGKKKTE